MKTCKNLAEDDMNNGIAQFECSECGVRVGGPDAAEGYQDGCCLVEYDGNVCSYSPFEFCPACGAKVMR